MHGTGEVSITLDNAASDGERVLGSTFSPEVIAENIVFGEGPIWDKQGGQLLFTDICGDAIYKWKPGSKAEAILKPSKKANGMVLDRDGRLVVAGWSGRTVFRIEKNGSLTTLADQWEGKKLNSPNDIVVHSKTGWI